jgi:hypothetical protein
MIRKFLLVGIILFFCCCNSLNSNQNLLEKKAQKCYIIEETFENTSMKIFLLKTKNHREVIDKFLQDNSKLAFLSIVNNEAIFSSKEDEKWNVFDGKINYVLDNNKMVSQIQDYANLNTVYKFNCHNDYAVFGMNNGFQAFWVKESGKLKFLYYSTTYDISNLNEKDKSKVSSLIYINEFLKNK